MGERSYLAIGDVLALLREEFPDVTISKIRFLESRGLLVPERTPSGYRKFYEPDVDRLRWILRQQREHFLPLKVIKGRLENGMSDPDAPEPPLFEMGDPPPEREAEREPEPVLVGAGGSPDKAHEMPTAARAGRSSVSVVGSPTNRAPGRESAPAPAKPESARAETSPTTTGADPAGPTRAGVAGDTEPTTPRGSRDPRASADVRPEPTRSHGKSSASSEGGAPQQAGAETPSAGEAGVTARRDEPARTASRVPARSTAGLPGSGMSGASFTAGELANASGLEISGVEDLESFGLIAGRTVAGVQCYDEEAVVVAKLAARFAPYGLEARHLKIFKHAADRQTGLYSQVVTPLLRQRNPEARARAVEDLSELSELGEALMRCFTQAILRELTGG